MNFILKIDEQRRIFNGYLKGNTTIDFSDWGVFFLFIIGIWAIFRFGYDVELKDKISSIVLWFTAAVIMQYTKETHDLKNITRKQYDLNCTPFIVLNYENKSSYFEGFRLENIGRGIARNINIKPIVHQNLKEIIMRDSLTFPPITALKSDGSAFIRPIITNKMCINSGKSQTYLILKTMEIIKPKFERHLDLEFEILYESGTGTPHKTVLISSEFEEGYHIKEYK